MKKAYGLFGVSLIVMSLAYTQGTLNPASRVIAGPVTLLALACLIGSAIALVRGVRRRRS